METVKETIAKNLVILRKTNKLTQQELAEKLNYSDKAVSRWEHAETLPDIETLCKICEIYGVQFEYLLQKEQPKKNNPYVIKKNMTGRILTISIAACSVWIAMMVLYIGIEAIFSKNIWTLFIWALPLTTVVLQTGNRYFFGNRIVGCVMNSLTNWFLLLSIYLQLLNYNIWMLFIVGAPIQAVIVLTTVFKIRSDSSIYTEPTKG